jgi:hypothetical protein
MLHGERRIFRIAYRQANQRLLKRTRHIRCVAW